MRPERLTVEGFTAFRAETEVDFAGADLFALTGPTGAGKSSLIDALTFALYGSVPRLDARTVAPVISQGKLEARIRLDFTVEGVAHTAVRVVRRTAKGATTKEARLERIEADGSTTTLAGDADAVTSAVEHLLGLSFAHFCTCVVLPQGQFATLLHAEPRKRQDLLVELLDLGVFEQMASAARQRAAEAKARAEVLDGQLASLADASDEAVHEAERRVGVLDRLVERIDEAQPRLDELAAVVAEATGEAIEATRRAELLTGLAVPEDVRLLGERTKVGSAERKELHAAHEAAAGVLEAAEAALEAATDRRELERLVAQHRQREELAERLGKGEAREQETAAALAAATARLAEADTTYSRAKLALVEAQDRNRAVALAGGLHVGAPCPVCRQVVGELPEHEEVADLAEAERAQADALKATTEAGDVERAARLDHERVTEKLAEVRRELAELDEGLAGVSLRPTLERQLAEIDRLEADVRNARETERQRRRDRDEAEARAAALSGEEATLRQAFETVRDGLAELGPPPVERTDLAADWRALVTWADATRPEQEQRAAAARSRAEEAEKERAGIDDRIRETCAELEVVVGGGTPREAATTARERARSRHETLVKDQARRRELEEQRSGLDEQRQVAEELGRHLQANRFEKWILDEAVQRLVEGATTVLHGLTGGAYSLCLDESGANFAVVDHVNADAVRGAKTLSGGETFLASLALALALADQVADLAAGGSARLESIFCDEGFGSLDLETLDVVATALEELGAAGRMVGVVSHVRELADRLPVRFEVCKGPATSTVERVDA